MSVATKNPFAILDADDSSRPSSPASKPSAASAPAAPATRGAQKSRGGPASRGGKYYARGGKPAPKDAPQNTDDPTDPPPRKFDGRGRGRGARGGAQRGGRRPFDRHSQTGKIDSEKKIHQSWGGDDGNQELKAEQAADKDAAAEGVANEWGTGAAADTSEWAAPVEASDWATPAEGAPAAEGEKAEGRPRREREPEEEDNTLTLDQYLAKQAEKELDIVPKLETRKANEGDDSIWNGAVPIAKAEEEEAYFVGKTKSAPKTRAKKEEKVFLEIDARFDRPDRGGRGRGRGDRGGERGRARGGRGRGGRQSTPSTPVVDVDDQAAFPSLS
jgi:plasminogen activator inhibitor 1 RNA-binding protein